MYAHALFNIIYSGFLNRTSIVAGVAFASRVREEIEAGRRCPDGHVKDACGLPTVPCRFSASQGATQ